VRYLRSISTVINIVFALLLIGSYLSTHINPGKHYLWAFLGLGFPILLTINIAFLFYWLVRRKIQLIFSLVAIILGAHHISHVYQISFKTKPVDVENSIHVMSYNVRLFDLYNWTNNKETRNQIFEQLNRVQPDIICFQEFYQSDSVDFKTRDTLVKFLNANNYFEGYSQKARLDSHFGVATFSKYPIIHGYVGKFERERSNNYVVTDLLINGDTVRVINAHAGSIGFQEGDYQYIGGKGTTNYYPWEEKPKEVFQQKILDRLHLGFKRRGAQVDKLVEEVKTSPYPVILCGDFNDTPVSYTYGSFDKLLIDSFTEKGNGLGGTYIGYIPGLRIDYIFHSTHFKAIDYTTHPEKLSDHKAISTRLVRQ
jgi:endonuclease/exonuclease/phosphatase family metal-dependent hydrolase